MFWLITFRNKLYVIAEMNTGLKPLNTSTQNNITQ
jgi:hypothetical protein